MPPRFARRNSILVGSTVIIGFGNYLAAVPAVKSETAAVISAEIPVLSNKL
jgi:hypothetical protein